MIPDISGNGPQNKSSGAFIMMQLDRQGQIFEYDARDAELLGFPSEDMAGRFLWKQLPASLRIQLLQKIARTVTEQLHTYHQAFDTRAGRWLEYHVCPAKGGFTLLILEPASLEPAAEELTESKKEKRDLKEQVKMEARERDKLKETQERLEMALSAARMATWEYDFISGEITYSKNLHEALGISPEAAPRTVEAALPWFVPEDYDAHRQSVEAALSIGDEYVSEYRIKNPETGEVRWIENRGHAQRDDRRQPVRLYGILQDITARKSVQDELGQRVRERTAELDSANRILRESEERLNVALRNAPISMSIVDRNLCYKWLHHPLLKQPEKFLGKKSGSFLPAAEADHLNSIRRQVIQTGVGVRQEFPLHIEGREICYDMLIEPFRNQAAQIEGAISVALDVTERKHAEERLRTLNAALERRAEQLRHLTVELTWAEERERRRIAQMLHDHLQQLLVAAKFSAGTLSGHSGDEGVRSGLKEIVDLLDQSIAASRSLTAELVPPMLDEKGLPEALRWLGRWMQEKHGLEVVIQADERPKEVPQEIRVMLFQAVRELLFNVVKHAGVEKGIVTLCYGGHDLIAASVQDEGAGFDPESQEASGGKRLEGFGLLAIRERLAAIGGELQINSRPGQGTTATVRAPIRVEHPALPSQKGALPRAASGRYRIVVADDHPVLRQGFACMLQESPEMEVVGEAEDGRKAVELTRSLHPDVVVMDVSMPNLNGIEATRSFMMNFPKCGLWVFQCTMMPPGKCGKPEQARTSPRTPLWRNCSL